MFNNAGVSPGRIACVAMPDSAQPGGRSPRLKGLAGAQIQPVREFDVNKRFFQGRADREFRLQLSSPAIRP
jgi:hypothetical protein